MDKDCSDSSLVTETKSGLALCVLLTFWQVQVVKRLSGGRPRARKALLRGRVLT